ncbi:hypothetical protein ZIOFF_042407 [Zingiber officinale]|uniref:Uncharacterized protein n=1 Tax=Zingiber officinale TaxID=94328 RepID=A0A8J5FXD8_ZINOF|nr:hypothetical protein ZIOFF_042407 [Zingiber officinale]
MMAEASHRLDRDDAQIAPEVREGVLLGDVGTGKSSLVLRFVKGQFVEFQESTIGAAFFSQTLAVNDETVKFEIWDTAGQERYHSLAPMYYRGAAAAVIVYDMTNVATFARAKKWVQELQAQGSANTIMALAGNKADLLESGQVSAEASLFHHHCYFISYCVKMEIWIYALPFCFIRCITNNAFVILQEAQSYAQENGLFFMETSAKTAVNVNDIFYEIAKRLIRVQPEANNQGMSIADKPDQRIMNTTTCCS